LLLHENQAKSDQDFKEWITTRDQDYRRRHLIPDDPKLFNSAGRSKRSPQPCPRNENRVRKLERPSKATTPTCDSRVIPDGDDPLGSGPLAQRTRPAAEQAKGDSNHGQEETEDLDDVTP
jgi:hypothetical protein